MASSLWSHRGLAAASPAMINSSPTVSRPGPAAYREAAFVGIRPSDASMFVKRPLRCRCLGGERGAGVEGAVALSGDVALGGTAESLGRICPRLCDEQRSPWWWG